MRSSFSHSLSITSILIAALIIFILLPGQVPAQVRPVNDYGALGLDRLLKRINTTASIMMVGAHPDDEDSALLAYLARGENARTAYLSLTRGDGGQNIIGPELFESLGVIRTEELLQARRLDGAEQYFTRAFDYGFSKTLDEARQKWDEKVILCDAVRAIRTFRPLVVISRFSGTPADGHGQHQYAGYITPIAVKAAADSQQCRESGEPWKVLKFYVEQGFGVSTTPTVRLNTGQYDPLLGRSYFEIAMEGRSQHKSQGEGRLEFHGDFFSGLNLQGRSVEGAAEKSPFDGLDISINGIARLSDNSEEPLAEKLAGIQQEIVSINAKYRPDTPSEIVPDLAVAFSDVTSAQGSTRNPVTKYMLSDVARNLSAALSQAAGVQIDALSDRETVVPGETFSVTVNVFYPKSSGISVTAVKLKSPVGWLTTKGQAPKGNGQGFDRRETAPSSDIFSVVVPENASPTQPYWLEEPRDGDLFRWPGSGVQTLPFQPPLAVAEISVQVNGREIALDQPVQFRFADPARGEIRRDLNVVPALSVGVDHELLIVPESSSEQTRKVTVSITNNSSHPISGAARLEAAGASGWKVNSSSPSFSLKNKGEKTSVVFDMTIPAGAKAGTYDITAAAAISGSVATQKMTVIAYPHIQTHRFYSPAATKVKVLDLKIAPINVGYVMGSGDEVPDAIRQLGLSVTMLTEKDLAAVDLEKFDTIVVGIRATETRPDLAANNQRLIEYVKNGGNLIFQYQRGQVLQQTLAPYPITMNDTQRTAAGSIARVVDEDANVTILEPKSPIFNFPNTITAADFVGWVQERNAYNIVTYDPKYTPLLESHDAGETENKGGLVTVKLGKGNWTYCSYSLFRQLPAGVSGAYRLFANLLSLPKAPR